MQFEFSAHPLNKISADAIVTFAWSADRRSSSPASEAGQGRKESGKKDGTIPSVRCTELDKFLDGEIKRIAALEKFSAKRGEVLSFVSKDGFLSKRIIVLGLGNKDEYIADDLRRAVGSLVMKLKKKVRSIAFVLPTEDEGPEGRAFASSLVTEGVMLGNYEFMRYKSKDKNAESLELIIFAEEDTKKQVLLKEGVAQGVLFADATILARDLINEQAAVATPTYLANVAKDIAKAHPEITCKVYDKAAAEKLGMHAFLGIARASETPPQFIHLEYTPKKGKTKEKIAIVGKGITFDSGGISIKPGDYMMDMKMDMSGAALVLGVFSVIAKLKPNMSVIGLIAATPNLISGSAIVPGDVVKAMNGKTIEVLNTDAEGRVTLADSLSYAVKEKATKIIDFATLTGACVVALGPTVAGLFSNNVYLSQEIKTAASTAGERVWEMPLENDYKALNKSEVADIANIPNTRYGGAITAGLFLEEFVGDTPWAHLDIAGSAFLDKPVDISGKGGTGFGVRTMLNLLSDK